MESADWARVAAAVPRELAPYVLDFEWDRERLWALALPVESLPVACLEWQLDLPWWRHGDRPFALAPRAVLRDPARHPLHSARALEACLGFPLDITWRGGRWTILDGVHRLVKAVALGLRDVRVRKVPGPALAAIAVPGAQRRAA
jgi:hypothetical protein